MIDKTCHEFMDFNEECGRPVKYLFTAKPGKSVRKVVAVCGIHARPLRASGAFEETSMTAEREKIEKGEST